MHFLIDGYNLLHALGMAPTPGGMSLERSRLRFLDWLAGEIEGAADDVCVVFDSKNKAGDAEQTHRGIRIRFSAGRTADDVIEDLIGEETALGRLTVVSNDHRIQQAARRKACISCNCGEYVDWLLARKTTKPAEIQSPIEDKPETASDAELDEWLKRFNAPR